MHRVRQYAHAHERRRQATHVCMGVRVLSACECACVRTVMTHLDNTCDDPMVATDVERDDEDGSRVDTIVHVVASPEGCAWERDGHRAPFTPSPLRPASPPRIGQPPQLRAEHQHPLDRARHIRAAAQNNRTAQGEEDGVDAEVRQPACEDARHVALIHANHAHLQVHRCLVEPPPRAHRVLLGVRDRKWPIGLAAPRPPRDAIEHEGRHHLDAEFLRRHAGTCEARPFPIAKEDHLDEPGQDIFRQTCELHACRILGELGVEPHRA